MRRNEDDDDDDEDEDKDGDGDGDGYGIVMMELCHFENYLRDHDYECREALLTRHT